MEQRVHYRVGRGQPSLEDIFGEDVTALRFKLPISQHAYLTNRPARGESAADLLRRLIDLSMRCESAGVDLEAVVLKALDSAEEEGLTTSLTDDDR